MKRKKSLSVTALVAAAVLGIAVTSLAGVKGWSAYGGDAQNNGRSTVELMTPLHPKVLWTNTVPENVTLYRGRPMVGAGGVVYMASGNVPVTVVSGNSATTNTTAYLYAFHPETGATNWTWEAAPMENRLSDNAERLYLAGYLTLDGSTIYATPVQNSGTATGSKLFAIRDNGPSAECVSNFPVAFNALGGSAVTGVTLDGNRDLYASEFTGSPSNGKITRVNHLSGVKTSIPISGSFLSGSVLTISSDGSRIIGSDTATAATVKAFDIAARTQLWAVVTDPRALGNRTGGVGTLYTPASNGTVYARRKIGLLLITGADTASPVSTELEPTNGIPAWPQNLAATDVQRSAMALSPNGQTLYVGGDRFNSVYALDAVTGVKLWSVNPSGNKTDSGAVPSAPVVTVNGLLIFTQLDKLYVYASDGTQVLVLDPDSSSTAALSSPTLAEYQGSQRVYVAGGKTMYAVELATTFKGTLIRVH